ncbi:MAG: hypothetical protein AABY84_05505 [Candidatus Firestonebacteria bacterium]
MESLTDKLKEYAKECRVDLVGIANIERFKDIPQKNNPSAIFPETKSVIVIGKRITRGTLRGIEEGTQFNTYNLYGYNWLEDRFLSITALKVSEFLEDNKWEAVPLLNLPVQMPAMGIPVKENLPAPNVLIDFDDAAVRTGLGEIGYIRVFLTPEFGPRQRFFLILTDAPLEPTPISKENICDRSKDYKKYCPLKAIDTDKEEILEICEKKMKVATIDYSKCMNCQNGAFKNNRHPLGTPDRLGAICVRSYLVHLEKNNRLKNTFINQFRKRPTWQILDNKSIIEEGSEIE